MSVTENIKNKKDLIEELEGILKANKDNIYCDEYQIADMVREALKLHGFQIPEILCRIKEVQKRTRAQAYKHSSFWVTSSQA